MKVLDTVWGLKAKQPSLIEVGVLLDLDTTTWNITNNDGTMYPLFGQQPTSPNILAAYKSPNGETAGYWVRTRGGFSGGYYGFFGVEYDGRITLYSGGKMSVIGYIRF